jgi:hypothetical protein
LTNVRLIPYSSRVSYVLHAYVDIISRQPMLLLIFMNALHRRSNAYSTFEH